MRITPTLLPGVVIIEPQVHRDPRGVFLEVYHAGRLEAAGIPMRVVQENQSRSVRGTIRGLHWQWRRPQAKLVRVAAGEVFDVAVDIRRGSPTFAVWVGVHMSAANFRQTYIPEGFAHGFCALTDMAEVHYMCSDHYDAGGEAGFRWDDPTVAIGWPELAPVLSPKDAALPLLHPSRTDLPVVDAAGRVTWPVAPTA